MITFPSSPLFTATESPPATAAGLDPQPLDALFAELLATASDALDLAAARDAPAGGKGLPPSGTELPPVDLAGLPTPAPVLEPATAQAPLLRAVPGEPLLPTLEPGADPAQADSLAAPVIPAPAAGRGFAPAVAPEAEAVAEPLPLPAGLLSRQISASGEGAAAPAAQPANATLPPTALASPQSQSGSPGPAEPALPAALPAEAGQPRAEGLVAPAAGATLAAQGEAPVPTQTVTPTAVAAAESPPQSQVHSQVRSPTPLPLQHAPQDPAFPGELANRLQVFARNGMNEATLQLHPAELGRLQVSITTEGDQARVLFVADNAAAREAIEQSLPRLRELLAQSGLQLAHSDVSDQSLAGSQRDDSAARSAGAHNGDSGPANPGADMPTGGESLVGTHLVDYYI